MKIKCWFDGACNPNPTGAMGYGLRIETDLIEFEYKGGELPSANNSCNVAEYMAFYGVLSYLDNETFPLGTEVVIRGDSNLVVNQMNGTWKIKDGLYKEWALKSKALLSNLEVWYDIKILWVSRDKNKIADTLSKKGIEVYL